MQTLLLKFSGPLQSWGVSSKFETRHTEKYPTKSAVVGMIAAALGLRRNDERIKELNQLDFAVRIDQAGKLLHDYHIARKYKNNGDLDRTYVTNRYYLEDAIFMVSVGCEDNKLVDKIEYSLKNPYFQLFLGRRSNPITADFIQGKYETDALSCLKELDWQASDWYKKQNPDISYLTILADADLLEDNSQIFIKDHVDSFSQKHRKFNFRAMSKYFHPLIEKDYLHNHDAFSSID